MEYQKAEPLIDFFIAKDYTYTDGEDDIGPDIYFIRAHDRRTAVRIVGEVFPDHLDMIKIVPIRLPSDNVVYLGTFLRENLDEFQIKIPELDR